MQTLLSNMRYLCDESRMLTGLTVAYGTSRQSEHAHYGRAQEYALANGVFIPDERPLEETSVFDLASLTKLILGIMVMILEERSMLSFDECVGSIDPRFENLKETSVQDVLCYRACLQTPGRIDAVSDREEGLRRLFRSEGAHV